MDVIELLKIKKSKKYEGQYSYIVFLMNEDGILEKKGTYNSYNEIIDKLNLPLTIVDLSNIALKKTKKYDKLIKIEKIKN